MAKERERVGIQGCIFTSMDAPFLQPPTEVMFDKEFCINHANWLISAAALAYGTEAEVERVVTQLWGMTSFQFFAVPTTDTQGFGMANDDVVVISFRGTDSVENWRTNRDIALTTLTDRPEHKAVKVHAGFLRAYMSIQSMVEAFLIRHILHKPSIRVYLTGHSLGGALCTLCLSLLTFRLPPIPVAGAYTIGQPRVGNCEFVRLLEERSQCVLQRIVNSSDIVPKVPPKLNGFEHYGSRIFLTRAGQVLIRPSRSQRSEASNHVGAIDNHSAARYLSTIAKAFENHRSRRQCPQGKLVLTVHQASGILLKESKVAVFCVVTCNRSRWTSEKINSHTPQWNMTVEIPEIYLFDEVIIEVFNESRSRQIGTAVFDYDTVDPQQQQQQQRTVEQRLRIMTPEGTSNGRLTVSSVTHPYDPHHYTVVAADEESDACVYSAAITVHNAAINQPFAGRSSIDPHCVIRTGQLVQRSEPNHGTFAPVWDMPFTVPAVQSGDDFEIEVWHRSTLIGFAVLTLSSPFQDFSRIGIDIHPDLFSSTAPLSSPSSLSSSSSSTTTTSSTSTTMTSSLSSSLSQCTGRIFVSCQFTKIAESPASLLIATSYITLHRITDLSSDRRHYDIFCKLVHEASGTSSKTAVAKHTRKPRFNHSFSLPKVLPGDSLLVQVYTLPNKLIGCAELRMCPLIDLHELRLPLYGLVGEKHNRARFGGALVVSLSFTECRVVIARNSSIARGLARPMRITIRAPAAGRLAGITLPSSVVLHGTPDLTVEDACAEVVRRVQKTLPDDEKELVADACSKEGWGLVTSTSIGTGGAGLGDVRVLDKEETLWSLPPRAEFIFQAIGDELRRRAGARRARAMRVRILPQMVPGHDLGTLITLSLPQQQQQQQQHEGDKVTEEEEGKTARTICNEVLEKALRSKTEEARRAIVTAVETTRLYVLRPTGVVQWMGGATVVDEALLAREQDIELLWAPLIIPLEHGKPVRVKVQLPDDLVTLVVQQVDTVAQVAQAAALLHGEAPPGFQLEVLLPNQQLCSLAADVTADLLHPHHQLFYRAATGSDLPVLTVELLAYLLACTKTELPAPAPAPVEVNQPKRRQSLIMLSKRRTTLRLEATVRTKLTPMAPDEVELQQGERVAILKLGDVCQVERSDSTSSSSSSSSSSESSSSSLLSSAPPPVISVPRGYLQIDTELSLDTAGFAELPPAPESLDLLRTKPAKSKPSGSRIGEAGTALGVGGAGGGGAVPLLALAPHKSGVRLRMQSKTITACDQEPESPRDRTRQWKNVPSPVLQPHGTVEAVCQWLRERNLEIFEASFRENDIDIDSMFELKTQDLKDMGVVALGPRLRFLSALADAAETMTSLRRRSPGPSPALSPRNSRQRSGSGSSMSSESGSHIGFT